MPVRKPARIVATLLAVSLGLASPPARAQPSAQPSEAPPAYADDLVNLKNGDMVRGKLLEVLTDESVTIVSATTGLHRTFPWADVASFERGGQTTQLPTPAPPPPELEPELVPGPGTPRLHLETSRPAPLELYEITAEVVATDQDTNIRGIAYRPICTAPCDRIIDARRGQSFFFGGEGITHSPRFTLSEQTNDVVAHVKPGRRRLRFGGLLVLAFGGAGIVSSGILFAVASRGPRALEYDSEGKRVPFEDVKPNYTPATAIMITGAAMVVTGVVMYVLGRTTHKFSPRRVSQRRIRPTG